MGDSRDPLIAAYERQYHIDQATIAALREELADERGLARGYRRHWIEHMRRCRDCETCNPPASDQP